MRLQCAALQDSSDEDIDRILLVVMLNSFALQHRADASMLQGIFPLAAMANHSCWPNSTHMACAAPSDAPVSGDDDDGLWMRLRAVRDIAEGEEITISYLDDLMLPLEERVRAFLLSIAKRRFEICTQSLAMRLTVVVHFPDRESSQSISTSHVFEGSPLPAH